MKYSCTCKHDSQDKLHGKGIRIFNAAFGKGGAFRDRYRCTVCLSLKTIHKEKQQSHLQSLCRNLIVLLVKANGFLKNLWFKVGLLGSIRCFKSMFHMKLKGAESETLN